MTVRRNSAPQDLVLAPDKPSSFGNSFADPMMQRAVPNAAGRRWPPAGGTRRLPSLSSLAYFEVAARTKSFAVAAKELHVTPAAVSQQIKALEEDLGVELFFRHHRRVIPSALAKAVLPLLQEGFAAIADAVDQIRAHSEDKWVITVCAEPLFATRWLVPRLHRFYSRCQNAEVRLQASVNSIDARLGSPVGLSTFQRAGIDMSVRFGYGDYAGLETKHLLNVSIVPVCSPALKKKLRTPADLLSNTLLSDGSMNRSPQGFGWREWLEHAGLRTDALGREQQFGNGLLALEAAVSGLGVLLANRSIIQAELDSGKLVTAFGPDKPTPFSYFAVCPPASLDRPIVQMFRKWLLDETKSAAKTKAPIRRNPVKRR